VIGASESVIGANGSPNGADESPNGASQSAIGTSESVIGASETVIRASESADGADQTVFGASESVIGANESVSGADGSASGANESVSAAGAQGGALSGPETRVHGFKQRCILSHWASGRGSGSSGSYRPLACSSLLGALMNISRRVASVVVCLAASLLLPACTYTIGPQSPHPNVALMPQQQGMRLVVADGITDHVSVYPADSAASFPFEVQGWRTTLAEGFRNGFGSSQPQAAGADLTLTLDEVRLEIGDFKPAHARIEYKATLSKGGVVIRRFAGTAQKQPGVRDRVIEVDVDCAVEAMYEQIGKELSANPTAG